MEFTSPTRFDFRQRNMSILIQKPDSVYLQKSLIFNEATAVETAVGT